MMMMVIRLSSVTERIGRERRVWLRRLEWIGETERCEPSGAITNMNIVSKFSPPSLKFTFPHSFRNYLSVWRVKGGLTWTLTSGKLTFMASSSRE